MTGLLWAGRAGLDDMISGCTPERPNPPALMVIGARRNGLIFDSNSFNLDYFKMSHCFR